MKRVVITSAVLLTFAGVALRQADGQQPANPTGSRQAAQHRALVNQYCVTCHNEKLKTGDLMLDKLDLEHVGAQAETWEKVARKVRAGLMPPSGAPRPQRAALAAFAEAVEQDLDRAAASTSNPGRAALHRMNRAEYANAIRDLLGMEIDPVTMLPADDSSNGFDNIADVLGVSPALLERYVSAAAKISRVAVGNPEISPLDVTYTVKGDLSQTVTADGLPMGTRGGTAIRHNFPLDGEYLVKLSLQKLSFGQVFGSSAEGEMLEVTLNGERVKLYQLDDMPYFFMRDKPGQPIPLGPLKDPSAQRVRMSPNINMEFRLQVKAGPQDIGVAFLNTSYVANEDLVHRPGASTFDSNNGMQYGYYTVPHLGKVDITGPYNATGSGDTPSRRKIFVCRPAREAQGLASPKPQEKAREAQARQRAASGDAELACAQKIISNLVRHAFRRPATDNDIELLQSFYQQGRNKGSFDTGIEMALRRILADPEFVFRFETPPANVKPGEAYRLGDLELASRLSFFLWSSIPDDQLLNTAIQGKLHEPAVLDREARRMLKDPKADALVHNFAGQWLFLRDLKSTNPDSREFPDFDDNLRQSFVRETEMLFESVLREDRSVLDLLNADYTFVNERLAKHYGIPGIYGPDFRRVTVPNDARRGLLGQGSMLLVTSNANRTSPVQRGKWILENILGSPPPLPPPNVPPLKESVVGVKPTSVRDRMEEHRNNPVCAACHKIMDPIGLALENFDGTGQWRTTDSGFAIDPSSQMVDGTPLDGPSSLRKALLSRPEALVGTMTQKLLMYGIGRETKYNDMPVVRAIMRGAEPNRYKFSDLILGVVRSAPFQMRVKENSPNTVAAAAKREADRPKP